MRFFHRINLLLAFPLFAIACNSSAADVMSAPCSEPDGIRYDRVGSTTKQDTDKFSGVNPQFIFSKTNPSKLTVIWPDSKKLGLAAKQQAHEATIVELSEGMVSAVTVYDERVDLYTLFPKQGVAFMSTHKNIPVQGGIPNGSIFKMECKFEVN